MQKTPEQIIQEEIKRLRQEIHWNIEQIDKYKQSIIDIEINITEKQQVDIPRIRGRIEELIKKDRDLQDELDRITGPPTLHVYVPEGGMEWLLHEVGHWVAATPEERRLPDYGYGQEEIGVGKAREWQAWAFEEIVLAPFGHSRDFIPPKQRGGVAFSKNQPIPGEALRHIERSIQSDFIDVAEWRVVYGDWIRHEQGRSSPSWDRFS